MIRSNQTWRADSAWCQRVTLPHRGGCVSIKMRAVPSIIHGISTAAAGTLGSTELLIQREMLTYIRCLRKHVVIFRQLLFSQADDTQVRRDRHKFGLYNRGTKVLDFPAKKGNTCARLNNTKKSATFIIKF